MYVRKKEGVWNEKDYFGVICNRVSCDFFDV